MAAVGSSGSHGTVAVAKGDATTRMAELRRQVPLHRQLQDLRLFAGEEDGRGGVQRQPRNRQDLVEGAFELLVEGDRLDPEAQEAVEDGLLGREGGGLRLRNLGRSRRHRNHLFGPGRAHATGD